MNLFFIFGCSMIFVIVMMTLVMLCYCEKKLFYFTRKSQYFTGIYAIIHFIRILC